MIPEIASDGIARWRVRLKGRISVLKRAHGLRRCLNHGLPGFERWVGWGVIAGELPRNLQKSSSRYRDPLYAIIFKRDKLCRLY